MENLKNHLRLHNEVRRKIAAPKTISPFKFKNDNGREVAAATLFNHVFELHRGVELCVNNKANSAAATLPRSMFEAWVRGLWILHCATPKQVRDFIKKDHIDFKFHELIAEIESKLDFGGNLATLKGDTWKTLNSLAHPGMAHLSSNFKAGSIQDNFNESQLMLLLEWSAMFTVFAYNELFRMAGKPKNALQPEELSKDTSAWVKVVNSPKPK